MKSMKIGIFKSFALLLITYYPTSVHGQIIDAERYHRASLISMLIERPMYPFNDEISDAFKNVPMPNRFNNHNLGVRIVRFATQEYTSQEEHIEQFIEKSFLSNRAIAKWFDWNKEDGSFSMDIIKERGFMTQRHWNTKLQTIQFVVQQFWKTLEKTLYPKHT